MKKPVPGDEPAARPSPWVRWLKWPVASELRRSRRSVRGKVMAVVLATSAMEAGSCGGG